MKQNVLKQLFTSLLAEAFLLRLVKKAQFYAPKKYKLSIIVHKSTQCVKLAQPAAAILLTSTLLMTDGFSTS